MVSGGGEGNGGGVVGGEYMHKHKNLIASKTFVTRNFSINNCQPFVVIIWLLL